MTYWKSWLVAALVAVGASVQASAALPEVIRIGVASPAPGNPPIYSLGTLGVARQKGFIEQQFAGVGTRLDWFFFKGAGPAVNEALTNGQLDLVLHGDLPSLIGHAAGLKTRLLLPLSINANIYLAVPATSTLDSLAALKGKKVAIFKGTNIQLPINRLLAAHGLKERDIRAINLDSATSQAALIAGDLDAAFGGYELLKLRDKGLVKILYSSRDDRPDFTRNSALLGTQSFIDAYPDATQKFINGLVQSAHWLSQPEHYKATLDIWALQGTPAKNFAEDFGPDLKPRHSPVFDPFILSRYQAAVDDAVKFRLTRTGFDVRQWAEPRFVNQALEQLQLQDFWPQRKPDPAPLVTAQESSQ